MSLALAPASAAECPAESTPTDAASAPAYAATLLRASLGTVMLAHAQMKFFTFTIAGTAQFFAAHGFPAWTALPVALAEAIAGAMLLLGVGSRWAAAALVPVMLGAVSVHAPNGWVFNAAGGGWEYVAFLTAALVTQALLGDGALALGPAIARRVRR